MVAVRKARVLIPLAVELNSVQVQPPQASQITA